MAISIAKPAETLPIRPYFSRVRWDFVFQRSQQCYTRAAEISHVVFVEELVVAGSDAPTLAMGQVVGQALATFRGMEADCLVQLGVGRPFGTDTSAVAPTEPA